MTNLKADERVSIQLRELYRSCGYLPYKVSKFEEYDLYMQNKSFLTSEHVLAFSDMDGAQTGRDAFHHQKYAGQW